MIQKIKINLRGFGLSDDVTAMKRPSSGCFVFNNMQLKRTGGKGGQGFLIVSQRANCASSADHPDKLHDFGAQKSFANVSTDYSRWNFLIPQHKLSFLRSRSEQ